MGEFFTKQWDEEYMFFFSVHCSTIPAGRLLVSLATEARLPWQPLTHNIKNLIPYKNIYAKSHLSKLFFESAI